MSNKIPLEPVLVAATQYVEQLNKILPDLPKSVQDLISGPSLSISQHALRRKAGVDSEDLSSRLDYTSELLNEELEDLMGTEPTDSSLMVPITWFNPPSSSHLSPLPRSIAEVYRIQWSGLTPWLTHLISAHFRLASLINDFGLLTSWLLFELRTPYNIAVYVVLITVQILWFASGASCSWVVLKWYSPSSLRKFT